jgi:hypothetical protein
MQSLERRLEALETATPIGEDMTSFIRFVAPGRIDTPDARAEAHGMEFLCEPDETQDEFHKRIRGELLRTLPHCSPYRIYLFNSKGAE